MLFKFIHYLNMCVRCGCGIAQPYTLFASNYVMYFDILLLERGIPIIYIHLFIYLSI